jgi:hypothetical protein
MIADKKLADPNAALAITPSSPSNNASRGPLSPVTGLPRGRLAARPPAGMDKRKRGKPHGMYTSHQ